MKLKLFFISVFAVGAVLLVGYVSHLGLTELMYTIRQTVQPDKREKDIESFLYHISESENSVRIFTVLGDFKYLKSYNESLENLQNSMKLLRKSPRSEAFYLGQLDSISSLLQQKTDTQRRLIKLSAERQKINLYEEALPKISSISQRDEINDSLREAFLRAELMLEKEIAAKEAALNTKREALNEDEKSGLFKNLFGESKKRKEQKELENRALEQYAGELEMLHAAKDTLADIADTLDEEDPTAEIQTVLSDIRERQRLIMTELAKTEAALTRKDHLLGMQIQDHIKRIQDHFDIADISRAEKASSFFDTVSARVTLIGSVFSMLFIIMILIVLNDFRVHEKNRKALITAKEKSEELARAKEEFLSSVSHEIRTPLNAVLGFIEQLAGAELQKQQREYVDIIRNASNHLLALINDILDFAKIESGKISIEQIPFSIEEQTLLVYHTLLKKATDKNLKFDIQIDKRIKNRLFIGDPLRYRQIIFNLLDNAIKFTDKGKVAVSVTYEHFYITVRVTDTGIGIPVKKLQSIFEKFDRVSERSESRYGGTGLGLAIAKNLTELQKGTISVTSTENKGSEFIVKIPSQTADTENPLLKENPLTGKSLSFKNANVLIADDEAFNRLLLETILNKHHIRNKSVSSGQEAIEMHRREHFDIVLTDLQMEGLSGFETARQIKENNDSPVMIAVTASSGSNINDQCQKSGFADVLVKPVSETDLLNCLSKHLELKPDPNPDLPQVQSALSTEHNVLNNLFTGDDAMSEKMTNIYRKNLLETIKVCADVKTSGELDPVRKAAHKIIPSSRHMGYTQFADLMKRLESNIEEGNKDLVKKELLPEAEKVGEAIMASLDNFLQEKFPKKKKP